MGITSARGDEETVQRLLSRPRPPFVPWEPEGRCSPMSWLDGARSVIVCALSYRDRYSKAALRRDQGYFSPFAKEPDYHGLVAARLDSLGAFIKGLTGARYTVQVDSGPGCERIFAALAGVGWQGKNNFIIVPGHGSFVWLGLLTTDLELPADEPMASQCGSCDSCLGACPTKAYSGPHQFDHNLCMAYWAADKGELSPEKARILSKHKVIYGCDYCQLACPHNQLGEQGPAADLSLAAIISMSKAEFEKWFRSTAAGWRGRTLLRRNAVLASAGNSELRRVLERIAQEEGGIARYARMVLEDFPSQE